MVNIKLVAKGKIARLPEEVSMDDEDLVLSLIDNIAQETKLHASRIRLTVKPLDGATNVKDLQDTVLKPNDRLTYYASRGQATIYVRDMGPQISWKTVYLIEYLGPILIHYLFYSLGQSFIYGEEFEHTLIQQVVFWMVMAHFAKRELETLFVHKFSKATMPLFNLFKNSGHYWVLSGLLIAYFVYAPDSWQHQSILYDGLFGQNYIQWEDNQVYLIVAGWAMAEVSNLIVHLNLSSLRRPGTTERQIPRGFGFEKVSCPNYFFEAWGWLLVSVLCQNWTTWLFFIVGSVQMYIWAVKKHHRYLKEFPDYPKDRKAFIPYIA